MSLLGGYGFNTLNNLTPASMSAIQRAIESAIQVSQFQQESSDRDRHHREQMQAQEKARKEAEKARKKSMLTSLGIGAGVGLATAGLGAALAPAAGAAVGPALGATEGAIAGETIAGTGIPLTASTVADAALAAPTAGIGSGIIDAGAAQLAMSPVAAGAGGLGAGAPLAGGLAGGGAYAASQGQFLPSMPEDMGMLQPYSPSGGEMAAPQPQLGMGGGCPGGVCPTTGTFHGEQGGYGGTSFTQSQGGYGAQTTPFAGMTADQLATAGGYGIRTGGDRLKLFGLMAGQNLANLFAPGAGQSLGAVLGSPMYNYNAALATGTGLANLGLKAESLASEQRIAATNEYGRNLRARMATESGFIRDATRHGYRMTEEEFKQLGDFDLANVKHANTMEAIGVKEGGMNERLGINWMNRRDLFNQAEGGRNTRAGDALNFRKEDANRSAIQRGEGLNLQADRNQIARDRLEFDKGKPGSMVPDDVLTQVVDDTDKRIGAAGDENARHAIMTSTLKSLKLTPTQRNALINHWSERWKFEERPSVGQTFIFGGG